MKSNKDLFYIASTLVKNKHDKPLKQNSMAEKWGGVINYIIGILLMVACLFILKKRAVENPGMKLLGMSIKTISIIVYVGIAIDVFLIVTELVK